jgi:hypothetical protein
MARDKSLTIGGLVKPVTPKQKAAAFLRWRKRKKP